MKFKSGQIVKVDRQDDDDPDAITWHGIQFKVLSTRETPTGSRLVQVADMQTNRRCHVFREQDLEAI